MFLIAVPRRLGNQSWRNGVSPGASGGLAHEEITPDGQRARSRVCEGLVDSAPACRTEHRQQGG
jgi:hypothetical protein